MKVNASKNIGQYLMKGHAVAESRLKELDLACDLYKRCLERRELVRYGIRAIGLGKVTPKVRRVLRILASRTIQEIREEREAFLAILGTSQRSWEYRHV